MSVVQATPGSRAERAARRALKNSDPPFPKSPKPPTGAKHGGRKRGRPQDFGAESSQENPRSQESKKARKDKKRDLTAKATAARRRRGKEKQEQEQEQAQAQAQEERGRGTLKMALVRPMPGSRAERVARRAKKI